MKVYNEELSKDEKWMMNEFKKSNLSELDWSTDKTYLMVKNFLIKCILMTNRGSNRYYTRKSPVDRIKDFRSKEDIEADFNSTANCENDPKKGRGNRLDYNDNEKKIINTLRLVELTKALQHYYEFRQVKGLVKNYLNLRHELFLQVKKMLTTTNHRFYYGICREFHKDMPVFRIDIPGLGQVSQHIHALPGVSLEDVQRDFSRNGKRQIYLFEKDMSLDNSAILFPRSYSMHKSATNKTSYNYRLIHSTMSGHLRVVTQAIENDRARTESKDGKNISRGKENTAVEFS